jgi:4-alpha-glucanotransferase
MYLPHRFEPDTVVYTGTHDNDTMVGWWKCCATEEERRYVRAYLGPVEDGIHWGFIRAAQTSVARWCVIPLQDVLGLGSEARMNTPSRTHGNWGWRYQQGVLAADIAERLAALADVTDRLPDVPASAQHSADQFAA